VSLFHSISFLYFSYCFRYFAILSSVLIQLIRSCGGGYFSVAKRSHFLVFPYGLAPREGRLSLFLRPVVDSVFGFFELMSPFIAVIRYDHSPFTCPFGDVYHFDDCFLFSTVDLILGFKSFSKLLVWCYHRAPNFFVFYGPVRVEFYMFVVFFFQYLCCFCTESDAT
jgi:hypothetical protein